MTHKKESTGEEIYSGTATFGRVMAVIGVVIGTIAGLIMVPLGIYLIIHKSKLTSQTTGKVSGTQGTDKCSPPRIENGDTIIYDCNFDVDFDVGKNHHSISAHTSSTRQYKGGDGITVYYNPGNPSNASISSDNTHVAGIVTLVLGIIIPLVAWIWWYFARKYKAVAAAGGIAAGVEMLTNRF